MNYYFSRTFENASFEDALTRTINELKKEGFGILTEIDVKKTLKEKLDVEFPKYLILGACNPPFAHQALEAEERVGLMLPCNVIVRETRDGKVEVAAIDPIVAMSPIDNESLRKIAEEVREKLKTVIDNINL